LRSRAQAVSLAGFVVLQQESDTPMQSPYALTLDGITKGFPGIVANDRISLQVQRGHIHALLGENGAGKSTLMKILYGVYRPDSGTIALDGKTVTIRSPNDARTLGIGMVFQAFMLIPAFTVAENVALGLRNLGIILQLPEIEARVQEISDRYAFGLDPKAPVWQLSIGAQQKIEIVKLVLAGARLLIFDEPTSVLAPHEAEGLFTIFRSLRDSGYTIIFISHKLHEVLSCCDAITVLRHGRVVGSLDRAEATEEALVSLIIGGSRSAPPPAAAATPEDAATVLHLRGVEVLDDRGRNALSGMDISVRAGEIVGIAGVSGNGQRELGDVVQGVRKPTVGVVEFGSATDLTVAQRRAAGLACIPEDPLEMGAVRTMTVEENLALGEAGSSRGWRPINWLAARAKASWITDRFQLAMPRLNVAIDKLSGGNVQRIVCARELSGSPQLLLAYYPTRGMDIGAAEMIRTALRSARADGAGILLVSEDLDELLSMSDRLVVMSRGRNVGEFTPETADVQEIGFLMTGGTRAA
jgi:general nucleoside transport system ATP-binding protein